MGVWSSQEPASPAAEGALELAGFAMASFFESLLSSNFMPHGYCLQWEPGIVWLHVGSDVAIALAYFSIPVVLLTVARTERWAPYAKIMLLFGAFITACGATHLMSIWTLWHAHYVAEGAVKFITAAVSITAAAALVRFSPQLSTLRTPAEFEAAYATIAREIEHRTRAEAALRQEASLLRCLMEHVPASIYVKDSEGRFVLSNKHYARELGAADPDEVVGRTSFDFNEQSGAEEYARSEKQIISTGVAQVNIEERRRLLRRHDGDVESWAIATKAPWLDANGKILGVIGVSLDISKQKRAQAEAARLASIVQTANVAVVGADLEGVIQSWNRGAEALFDQTAIEMIGRNIRELAAPEARAELQRTLNRVRNGERIETAEALRVKSGGEILQVSETISAVIDQDGSIVGLSLIATDVTQKIATERALQMIESRLSTILEHTAAGIFVRTLDGRYVMSNPAHAAMCGLSSHEVLGKTDADLATQEVAAARRSADRQATSSRSPIHSEETLIVQGEQRAYHVVNTPMWDADGKLYAICGVATDITERKQAEEARRLNRKLIEANRDLAERHREMQRLRDMQNEFLAGMSHELRTPLNAIIGFSDLLNKQIAGPLSEKQMSFVQRVRDGGQHLLQLINNVLDAAKMEAGRVVVTREPVALAQLIKEVAAVMEPLASQREVDLVIDAPDSIMVESDPLRARQILYNLASNAIKFAREGGRVKIEAERWADFAAITVTDDGPGIEEADQTLIFERFRQASRSAKSPAEGAGLGLFISKMLVELLGGSISVESRKGEGARFRFTLPLLEPDSETSSSDAPESTRAV
jgi:PAS domain S-box-containing protein